MYIAQPPLYKVKKGKQERYVKDDAELDLFLMELALEDASVAIGSNGERVEGNRLQDLARDYLSLIGIMKRLSKRVFPDVLETMVAVPLLEGAALEATEAVDSWFQYLHEALNTRSSSNDSYETEVHGNGQGGFRATLRAVVHGVESERILGEEFFRSAEYRNLVRLGKTATKELPAGSRIIRGDKVETVKTYKAALEWLLGEAKRGIYIQRYKGLGEMNPDQLWDTTMDPTTRRLLQVRIEDALVADNLFTTLMGDQVEPRREFIETNALSVANIDI